MKKVVRMQRLALLLRIWGFMEFTEENFNKLYEFYESVSRMVLKHDVISDCACVTTDKLSSALEKVDENWHGWN